MISKPVWIYAEWSSSRKDFNYYIRGHECTLTGEVLIERRDIQFETPNDIQLKKDTAIALKAQRQRILADAQVEAMEIDQKIQELLAIEDFSKRKVDEDDLPF